MIENTKILQGHEGAIYKIVFDGEHRKLYSAGGDGWLVEWNVDQSSDGVLLAKVPDKIFSLAITPHYFLLGTFQGNFYILDRETKTILHQEKAHKHGIFSILAKDSWLYTLGGDGHIIRWNGDTFEKSEICTLAARGLRTQALNPEGNLLAVGSSDGSIYVLSFPSLYLRKQIVEAHDPTVFSLLWMENKLISGGRDALLKTWDIGNDYELDQTINAHWFAIYDIITTPHYLITSSRDKSIRWWNRHSLEPVTTIKWGEVMEAHVHSVNTLAIDEENNLLYSGSEDRTIRVWKMDTTAASTTNIER